MEEGGGRGGGGEGSRRRRRRRRRRRLSFHLRLGIPNSLFPSGFPNKIF
jgi:hypothetical protein